MSSRELPEYLGCSECAFGQFRDKLTGVWFRLVDPATDKSYFACSPEHMNKAVQQRGLLFSFTITAKPPKEAVDAEFPEKEVVRKEVTKKKPSARKRPLQGLSQEERREVARQSASATRKAAPNPKVITEEQKQKALRNLMDPPMQALRNVANPPPVQTPQATLSTAVTCIYCESGNHTVQDCPSAKARAAADRVYVEHERYKQEALKPQQYVGPSHLDEAMEKRAALQPEVQGALDRARAFHASQGEVPLHVRARLARGLQKSLQETVSKNITVEDVSFTGTDCRQVDIAISVRKPVDEIVLELKKKI